MEYDYGNFQTLQSWTGVHLFTSDFVPGNCWTSDIYGNVKVDLFLDGKDEGCPRITWHNALTGGIGMSILLYAGLSPMNRVGSRVTFFVRQNEVVSLKFQTEQDAELFCAYWTPLG